ncbi:hypothetical protein [Burkholderia cepacia]|uniref:hypothetical protein n=1 Tax=Burkholderia cepacia TaxID=292 RepID=UPI002AB7D286|nr:hypothetical protein [Burkholderia cepacia]
MTFRTSGSSREPGRNTRGDPQIDLRDGVVRWATSAQITARQDHGFAGVASSVQHVKVHSTVENEGAASKQSLFKAVADD